MIKKYTITGISIVMALLAVMLIYRLCAADYVSQFKSIPSIVSVENMLDYEGHTAVDLSLKNGGFLSLSEFNDSIFYKTNYVILTQLGDTKIVCTDKLNSDWVVNAFNLIEFVKKNTDSFSIGNINDIVNHYREIELLLNKEIPLLGTEPLSIELNPKNEGFDAVRMLCNRQPGQVSTIVE